LPEGTAQVDADVCIDCGACVGVCPTGAVTL
jgi:ferredoxin